jgi:hypothetical protein
MADGIGELDSGLRQHAVKSRPTSQSSQPDDNQQESQ